MLTLGSTIRQLRQEAELTQQELAGRVGITASHLSHVEAGRREPSLKVIRAIAQVLPVWPGLLLGAFVQTDMPDPLRSIFKGFVDELLASTDAAQLPLPLEGGGK